MLRKYFILYEYVLDYPNLVTDEAVSTTLFYLFFI